MTDIYTNVMYGPQNPSEMGPMRGSKSLAFWSRGGGGGGPNRWRGGGGGQIAGGGGGGGPNRWRGGGGGGGAQIAGGGGGGQIAPTPVLRHFEKYIK